MYWIIDVLFVAGLAAMYSVGWHRGKNGLGFWPFTVGKDGIHRQPLVLLALGCALTLGACTNKYAPGARAPDSSAVADSDRHDGDHDRDHDQGKKRKPPHEDGARP